MTSLNFIDYRMRDWDERAGSFLNRTFVEIVKYANEKIKQCIEKGGRVHEREDAAARNVQTIIFDPNPTTKCIKLRVQKGLLKDELRTITFDDSSKVIKDETCEISITDSSEKENRLHRYVHGLTYKSDADVNETFEIYPTYKLVISMKGEIFQIYKETITVISDVEKRKCVVVRDYEKATKEGSGRSHRFIETYQCHKDKYTTSTRDIQYLMPEQSDDVEIDRTFEMQLEE